MLQDPQRKSFGQFTSFKIKAKKNYAVFREEKPCRNLIDLMKFLLKNIVL